jgi:YjbE family integral membrane protein
MPTGKFLIAGLTLVWIDLLLAGDNALVIALAVRRLPERQRRTAAACGAALAVILRVGLTFVTAELLKLQFLKLAGGLFILWIAYRVLVDSNQPEEATNAPESWARALWYVTGADLAMSVDNILAIAGASGGHFGLILFGLAVSIPFIVVSSNLLARLMNRFPIVIYAGSALLGKVGGDMMLTDPWVESHVHVADWVRYAVDAVFAAGILIAGRIATARAARKTAPAQ